MDLNFTPDELAFRSEIRAWVAQVGDRLRSLPIPPEFVTRLATVSVDEVQPVVVSAPNRPYW